MKSPRSWKRGQGLERKSESAELDAKDEKFLTRARARWETKDSGERREYPSGMRRDRGDQKPRFDLLIPRGQSYDSLMLTRVAELLQRGAEKYDERNWELASTEEELDDFYESAFRHLVQWLSGETDEDHAAAVIFNVIGAEYVKGRL